MNCKQSVMLMVLLTVFINEGTCFTGSFHKNHAQLEQIKQQIKIKQASVALLQGKIKSAQKEQNNYSTVKGINNQTIKHLEQENDAPEHLASSTQNSIFASTGWKLNTTGTLPPKSNIKILKEKDCIGNLFKQQWKITSAGTKGLANVKNLKTMLSFSLYNTTTGKNYATIYLPLKDKLWLKNTKKISFAYQGRKENKKSFFSVGIAHKQNGRWVWKISKGTYANSPTWKKINFDLGKDFAMPEGISEIIMVKIIINSSSLPKGHEAILNFKDWKISE